MRRCILTAWLCLALALLPAYLLSHYADKPFGLSDSAVPIGLLRMSPPSSQPLPPPKPSPTASPDPTSVPSPDPTSVPSPDPTSVPSPAPASDRDRTAEEAEVLPASALQEGGDNSVRFLVKDADGCFETTLTDYLPGVVAGEMPASFEPEALCAQAVAARTYILRRLQTPSAAHPDCAVCTDPACCCAWLGETALRGRWGSGYDDCSAKIREAVRETNGEYLSYGGAPILACFHSSSPGSTESAGAVWSEDVPYLICVRSPETAADVPGFLSSATWSAAEFRERIESAHPEAMLGSDPSKWIACTETDESGRVQSMVIGEAEVRGTELRTLFSLRSAAFRVWWTGSDFLFTVEGSGHGVGMSQYGANTMALSGSSWRDITAHYYPGAEISRLG